MGSLRVDEVRALLPPDDELRPLLERILATSEPDPERRWTASGELETVGERLVRPGRAADDLPDVLERVRAHLAGVWTAVLEALAALEVDDRAGAARAFLRAASREEDEGRMERAEAWARAAHTAVEGLRDRRPAAEALRRLARAARARGRLAEAARAYEEAWRTARDADAFHDAVVAATGRGNVAVDQGGWGEAGAWYARALDLLGPSGPPSRERWQVYQNLSIVARRSGDLDAAEGWLARADEVAAALGDEAAAAEIENGRGMVALAAGRPEEAERRFRAALAAPTADARARVTVAVNLGEALLATGRTLEAAQAARDAERTALLHRVVTKLPEVYRLLGEVAAAREHADAFVFFERALEIVSRWELPDWERARTLEAYARLEAARDEGATAAAYLREAVELYRRAGSEGLASGALDVLERLDAARPSGSREDPNTEDHEES